MNLQNKNSFNSILVNLPSYGLVKNEILAEEIRAGGMEVFDYTIGDPKEPTPDFIIESLRSHISQVSQYPSNNGLLELRTAATDWLQRRFEVNCDPKKHVISSNGSKEAVFHVPQILLNLNSPRNIIVFPEPAYPVYKSGTILAGGEPCEIPLKESCNFVFDTEDIPKEKISRIAALWVCYPHNPTAAQINEKEAHQIYRWALENDVVLLSDECYVDMYERDSTKPLSFLQIAQKENYKNLLCFFSLSKRSGMTGYRSGFIAGDENLISLFSKYRLNVGAGTPNFIQHAAISAWKDDAHVQIRNEVFFQKRKMLEDFLIKNNFEFLKSNSTFYIWATIPKSYTCSKIFCETLARKAGIFVTPGEVFGQNCKKYFRLALVPTLEQIERSLQQWQTSIHAKHFL